MLETGSSGICLDGRENHGQGQDKLLHKERIRTIDGTVLVEEASHLHAGPCQAEIAEIEVAQNALCFTALPGLAKSRQRIDAYGRSAKQVPEEPGNKTCLRLRVYALVNWVLDNWELFRI